MINVILVLFIIVIFVFALKNSIKHFKGESSCCGGGSGTLVEKKHLANPVVEKKDSFYSRNEMFRVRKKTMEFTE